MNIKLLSGLLIALTITACQTKNKSSSAEEIAEFSKKVDEIAAQRGITDKETLALKIQVLSIQKTADQFDFHAIAHPCRLEIEDLCASKNDVSDSIKCIKEARKLVSEQCEMALKQRFGGTPLREAQVHRGVLVPKGSTLRYGLFGEVNGAIAAENFIYNGIHFKKGQISFHDTGLSAGSLVSDQYIDGIEYLASGLGPFFNEEGDVVNASLSKDTEIEGVVYMANTQITFHSKGRVESGRVAQAVTVQEESYIVGDRISFKDDGSIDKNSKKLNLFSR